MKKVLLYLLLFLAVIGLILGIFYLVITIKTPTVEQILDDVINEMDNEEVTEEVKLVRGEDEEGLEEIEWLVYEGEGFSFEYPEGYALDDIEIKTGVRDILMVYDVNPDWEELQIGLHDFYRGLNSDDMLEYLTFHSESGLVLSFILFEENDSEILKEILETLNFE